jgi:hypothetical protein
VSEEPLSSIERAALNALAEACDFSYSCHPPEHAILCKAPKHLRGDIRKGLDKLRRKGLAQKHPTRGGITWNLTKDGLRRSQQ